MKTSLFVLCFLCATVAMGQVAATQSGAVLAPTFQVADHANQAAPQPMAQEKSLLGSSTISIAHGEMPLSEVPLPVVHVTPLGDVARMQREEHATTKKAVIVWEN